MELKTIPGFSSYKARTDGTIWSYKWWRKKGRKMKLQKTANGYLSVSLISDEGEQKTKLVHHLILETFVGPRPLGGHTRHFPDPTKTNNQLSNLQWGTPHQNQQDQLMSGKVICGEKSSLSKLTATEVLEIRRKFQKGVHVDVLAKEYGIARPTLYAIKSRRSWKHLKPEVI